MVRACRVVVLALLMFAVIGLASAADKAAAPAGADDDDYADQDYSIGAISSGAASSPNSVVAAPLGGPVPPGAFDNAQGGDSTPSAAASSLGQFSAVAGVASAALAAAFYF